MASGNPAKEKRSIEARKAVGKTIASKYVLKRVIGEGGMGAVYEAEHVEIGKRVAIEIVRELYGQEDEVALRFVREARAASAIENDHIIQVFDVGQDPKLGLFMVMELLPGEDLGSLLGRIKRLEPPLACAIIDQAASALESAHAAGVIHRDLKPENVFLKARDDGSALVKLVDFGIAKVVREARGGFRGGNITQSGSVLGSPCYMSPEQAQGFSDIDERTDIYSLGAVLYEMLVGARAFEEKPTYEQTIVPIITQNAPRVSATIRTISPELDKLVADMMASRPANRPRDMTDVRRRLVAIQPGVDETRLRIAALERGTVGVLDSSSVERMLGRPHRTGGAVTTDRSELNTIAARPKARSGRLGLAVLAFALATVLGGAAAFYLIRVRPMQTTHLAAPAPTATAAAVAASTLTAEPDPSGSKAGALGSSARPAVEPAPEDTTAPSASASASINVEPATSASALPSAAVVVEPATGTVKPSAAPNASNKPRGGAGRPPAKPADQVGGVGITTQF